MSRWRTFEIAADRPLVIDLDQVAAMRMTVESYPGGETWIEVLVPGAKPFAVARGSLDDMRALYAELSAELTGPKLEHREPEHGPWRGCAQ